MNDKEEVKSLIDEMGEERVKKYQNVLLAERLPKERFNEFFGAYISSRRTVNGWGRISISGFRTFLWNLK